MSVTRVDVGGVALAVETMGEGPPLVALHGGLMERSSMLQILGPLADQRTIVAVDLRGHGESGLPDVSWDYEVLGADLLGVVDALRLERPAVVGFSDGANAALAAGLQRPGALGPLVLAGPVNHDSAHYRDGFRRMLGQPLGRPFDVDRFARERSHFAGFVQAAQGDRWRELLPHVVRLWERAPGYPPARLARMSSPTLYVFGEQDIIPRDEMDALAKETPGSRLAVVPGDHAWLLARPDEFAEMVDAFVAR